MRLDTACRATSSRGCTFVYWWDDSAGRWIGPTDESVVCAQAPPAGPREDAAKNRSTVGRFLDLGGLKRRLFPSTLWESRRSAVAKARTDVLDQLPDDATIILHTTYLSPLARLVAQRGLTVVVDIYDLVWRAHDMDAELAPRLVAALRRTYARSVRLREERCLARADALPVAGWTDLMSLPASLRASRADWSPTGVPLPAVERSPDAIPVAVGLIGHFGHSATSEAADHLLRSPVASEGTVEVVLAGLQSDEWTAASGFRARALGPVRDVAEFYDAVGATVVPVVNGAGMKCKLAESVLAYRVTVTTPHGAAGFPPRLRRWFTVLEDVDGLTSQVVLDALGAGVGEAGAEAFRRELSPDAAARRYSDTIAAAS